MRRVWFLTAFCCVVLLGQGCKGKGDASKTAEEGSVEVMQEMNGTISLSLKDAYLFNDESNPDRNTAEWGFTVNNQGRYEVWLSSLTQDTMHLEYNMPVIVTFGDKRLEGQPIGDEIVPDSGVDKPYFRAETRLGSIYIDDPGHYNIQLISEKVISRSKLKENMLLGTHTIFDQISLRPLSDI